MIFEMTLGWLWDDFGMTLGWLWDDCDDFEMTLGWLWDDFGMTLGWLWDVFGLTLGCFWMTLGYLWDDFGMTLGWFQYGNCRFSKCNERIWVNIICSTTGLICQVISTHHVTWLSCFTHKNVLESVLHLNFRLVILAIRVVEFSNGGYKIRNIFSYASKLPKGNYWILSFGLTASWQKVPKFDFQSQFSMSKIIRIFLNFFFIEEYQFRSTFFVIDFFDKINF